MWLGQITNAHNDLKTYATKHQIEFQELKPLVQEPPKAPILPEKTPAQYATIRRIAGGIIAFLDLVLISGIAINCFLVKK